MKIKLSPVRADMPAQIEVVGDTLIYNGQTMDFSGLAEGAVLPAANVACDAIVGSSGVARIGGQIIVAVAFPYGPNPPEQSRFPETIDVISDGPVTLPPYSLDEDGNPFTPEVSYEASAVTINWALPTPFDGLAENEMRDLAFEMIKDKHASMLRELTSGYSPEERETWMLQREAATAQLDGTATERHLQLLTGLGDARDLNAAEMAALINAKGMAYEIMVIQADQLKRAAQTQVEQLVAATEVAALPQALVGLFDTLRAQAEQRAADWAAANG